MPSNVPALNGLRAFEVAGRHLNFRAASEELGVTQGAVAQQVRGLEAGLGLKLFERKSKGLAFTAVGRSYHSKIAEAFVLIREATETLRPDDKKVIISVTPTFATKWLIPNLPDLSEKYPDIDLRVLATEKVSSFHSDGIDLAIRQGKPPFGASLDSHLLYRNEIVAVASPLLVRGFGLPLAASQLALLPKVHDGHDLWQTFLASLSVSDAGGRGMRFNQTALAIDAAIAGQGVALASRFLVERDIESKRLALVLPHSLRGSIDFHLLQRRGAQRTPAVRRVVEWLKSKSAEPSGD